jgi:hypothetical protein
MFLSNCKYCFTGELPVIHQAQENLVEPPAGPQEEDSDPFEEEKLERTLSGFPPQQGHFKNSPPSSTLWIFSKIFPHFRHRYS